MSYLTRRDFINKALSSAAVTALGVTPLLAANPTESAWRDLERRLNGRLLRPGSGRYLDLYRPYNRRYIDRSPAAIALVHGAHDVRACIRWAREQGIHLIARAGGHSYGGYSATRGLLVDFSEMREVDLRANDGVATLSPGVRNRDIVRQFTHHNFTIPAGRCPTVAISGLTLGGGFGFSSRHLGLTSDHLRSTQIVTADGDVLHCSEKENPDLFWACRGGGGGNFGINTRFHFSLTPVNKVSIYRITWQWKHAREVLETLQQFIQDAPDELSLRLGIGSVGSTPAEIRQHASISALGQFFGSASDLEDVLQPLVETGPATTTKIEESGYWAAQRFFYHDAPHNRFGSKSHYIRRPLASEAIDILVNAVESRPPSSNGLGGGATFFGWGGAMNRISPTATAFVHRDSILLMDLDTSWTKDDAPPVARANLRWLQNLSDAVQPYVSGMSYQNFIDPTLKTWRHAYYGENLERLSRIKRKYDPDNFFHFAQSIPTHLEG